MSLPSNTRAVITGAAGGIGRAFAIAIAERGGSVLIADIDARGADETRRILEARGAKAFVTACDVSKLDQVERLATEAEARLGGVDLVINNAGVAVGGNIGDVPVEDWRWLIDINLWGVIYGCHVFVPRLRAQGSGHIINVASAAGFLSGPQMGPYNVSKAGVIAISETLAAELGGSGVGVTVLCPTFIKTNIAKASRGNDRAAQDMVQRLMDEAKLTADDVARFTLAVRDRGDLYAVPQEDAKWAWRAKRMNPERFYAKLLPRVMKLAQRGDKPDFKAIMKELFRSGSES